jgi:hypothetical protein
LSLDRPCCCTPGTAGAKRHVQAGVLREHAARAQRKGTAVPARQGRRVVAAGSGGRGRRSGCCSGERGQTGRAP